jgi:glycosyltransferase involved in cell wall biosynthesis
MTATQDDEGFPLKIAIIVPSLRGGGAEYVSRRWAIALSRVGAEVTFILTHGNAADEPEFGAKRLTSRRGGFLSKVIALRKDIRRSRYDVILSLMPYSNLLAILSTTLNRGIKPQTIISEHTIHAQLNRTDRLSHKVQWRLARALYRLADACVAVSHAAAADLTASCKLSSSRLWVVPNPAAEDVLPHVERPAPSSVRGTLAVIVPSRLVRQKRLALAIEAAHLVKAATGKAVRIEFYGQGPEERDLRKLAAEYNLEATFHGWVDRWYEHIPNDGIVLMTSSMEGFGNILVEAAAMSVPSVVSSKALGVADACIPNVTAQLVMGEKPIDYANGIMAASEMVIPDISRWLTRFSDDTVGDLLIRIIEETSRPPGLALSLKSPNDPDLNHEGLNNLSLSISDTEE